MALLRRGEEGFGTDSVGVARVLTARLHTVGCSGLRTISVRGFRLSSGDGGDISGFDLGPSPEEHLLASIGASLAQTLARVACARDLQLDRTDFVLDATVRVDPLSGDGGLRIEEILARATVASEDPAGHFSGVVDDVLAKSPLVAAVTFPVKLNLVVESIDPATRHSDWEI
jgi:hypothetical protein